MAFFKKFSKPSAKEVALADYERCGALDDSHASLVFRTRNALRVRANLNKTFIQGAKRELKYQADLVAAIKAGKATPERPKVESGYQVISSSVGELISYVPIHHAQKMYDLGGKYQTTELNVAQVFEEAASIAKEVADDLKFTSKIELLEFLRQESDTEAEPTSS